jgi:hypothetical protein
MLLTTPFFHPADDRRPGIPETPALANDRGSDFFRSTTGFDIPSPDTH